MAKAKGPSGQWDYVLAVIEDILDIESTVGAMQISVPRPIGHLIYRTSLHLRPMPADAGPQSVRIVRRSVLGRRRLRRTWCLSDRGLTRCIAGDRRHKVAEWQQWAALDPRLDRLGIEEGGAALLRLFQDVGFGPPYPTTPAQAAMRLYQQHLNRQWHSPPPWCYYLGPKALSYPLIQGPPADLVGRRTYADWYLYDLVCAYGVPLQHIPDWTDDWKIVEAWGGPWGVYRTRYDGVRTGTWIAAHGLERDVTWGCAWAGRSLGGAHGRFVRFCLSPSPFPDLMKRLVAVYVGRRWTHDTHGQVWRYARRADPLLYCSVIDGVNAEMERAMSGRTVTHQQIDAFHTRDHPLPAAQVGDQLGQWHLIEHAPWIEYRGLGRWKTPKHEKHQGVEAG